MPEGEVGVLFEEGGVGLVFGGAIPIDIADGFAGDLFVEILKVFEMEDGALMR